VLVELAEWFNTLFYVLPDTIIGFYFLVKEIVIGLRDHLPHSWIRLMKTNCLFGIGCSCYFHTGKQPLAAWWLLHDPQSNVARAWLMTALLVNVFTCHHGWCSVIVLCLCGGLICGQCSLQMLWPRRCCVLARMWTLSFNCSTFSLSLVFYIHKIAQFPEGFSSKADWKRQSQFA
jgi:hypothetical protein